MCFSLCIYIILVSACRARVHDVQQNDHRLITEVLQDGRTKSTEALMRNANFGNARANVQARTIFSDERSDNGSLAQQIPKVIWSYWDAGEGKSYTELFEWIWNQFVDASSGDNGDEAAQKRTSIRSLHTDRTALLESLALLANNAGMRGKPPWLDLCQLSWQQLNPGYEIRILDSSSAWNWLDNQDLPVPREKMGSGATSFHSHQAFSDAVRLGVLKKYGGIWMDASILLLKPLQQILGEVRPWFMLHFSGEAGTVPAIESWFLAAPPHDPLISQAQECFSDWHRIRSQRLHAMCVDGKGCPILSFEESGLFSPDQLKLINSTNIARFGDYLALHACLLKARSALPELWSKDRQLSAKEAAFVLDGVNGNGGVESALVGSLDFQLANSLTANESLLMKVRGHGGPLNSFSRKELACWNHTLKQVLFSAGVDPLAGCTRAVDTPRPRVVVTLATTGTPERMDRIKNVLDSLANQTMLPDRIILTLPDRFRRQGYTQSSAYLRNLEGLIPKLSVLQLPDYGPATKLLGGLSAEKDPDTILVVVDDDVVYHRHTVATLVSTMLSSDIDIAPAFKGETVCNSWGSRTNVGKPGIFKGYADGFGGVAYRVRFFDDSVWRNNESHVPRGCFYHDDVWIAGSMFKASGVRPYLVPADFDSVVQHPGHQKDSIHVFNAEHSQDDLQNQCEAHFSRLC